MVKGNYHKQKEALIKSIKVQSSKGEKDNHYKWKGHLEVQKHTFPKQKGSLFRNKQGHFCGYLKKSVWGARTAPQPTPPSGPESGLRLHLEITLSDTFKAW